MSDPGRLGNLIGRGSTAGDKDGATMPGTWQGGSPFETTPMPRDMGSGEPIGEGDINLPPPQSDDPPVDEPPVEDAGEPDDVPPSCPPPKCPPPSCGLPPICLPPICPPSNCSPPVGGGCLPTGPVSPCDDLPVDDLPVEEMPIDELPSEGESAEAGAEMSRIVPGYEITIAGEGFGLEPGAVQIAIAGLSLPLQVIAWTESEIRAVVPAVGVTEPTPVRLTVQGAAGEVLYEADVQLVPAPVSTE
ncbi:MAG: hypothetical protein GTO03_07805 [Planctomycetales bacterium]|nr:hypothetical protein [Planctomycetales bacterium]